MILLGKKDKLKIIWVLENKDFENYEKIFNGISMISLLSS